MSTVVQAETNGVRLRELRWECEGILRLVLEPIAGLLSEPEPGAHVDLHLPGGLVRQYSLTVGSSTRAYVIGVLREPKSRGGSTYVHETLRPGALLQISPPRNAFPLDDSADPAFLVSGGIGVTPLLAMAEELSRSDRPWSMMACVRSRAQLAFQEDIARFGIRVRADDEDGIPDMAALLADVPDNAHLYCCGPGPMLDAFVEATAARDPSRVHLERFEPVKPKAGEGEILVELARSGETIVVPSDKTILEALQEAGIDAPSSCRVGVCGTCEVQVLAGEPDHRDLILTDEEHAAGRMLLCCSRSKTQTLVLDL